MRHLSVVKSRYAILKLSRNITDHIAFSFCSAGILALLMNILKQPLLLGYLIGGFVVGPVALNIVPSHGDIQVFSSLGLVFLLFMIGLELDVKVLLKMGRVVIITGLLQFPICAGSMVAIFVGLESAGLNFGSGKYSAVYCGLCCGISSTMIVAKLLGEKMELDSMPGRLTVGILIFQDIWAIIVLAIQPNMASPEILGILKTFGMIATLLVVAVAYSQFLTLAIFASASKLVELMLFLAVW